MPTKQPPTKPGKLSDAARHVVYPSGITTTGWPAVRDKCRDFGVTFDPWQDGAGRLILSKRADGSYACSIGGVFISIPRQVGKTFLIMSIVFALCMLTPGLRVMWTAHHSDTSNDTFDAMQGFAKRKKVAPHVAKVLIDDMSVRFRNGSRIMFGARERGFGRGRPKIGLLVFDEAQILTERAASDMVPATNTVANALVLYTGTPPKPSDPSELFTNRRNEALSGDSDDLAYIEFSADRDAHPDDRKQWSKANPSYPTRTNAAAMLRMKKQLSADSFRREALGVWDEVNRSASKPEITEAQWTATEVAVAPTDGAVAYGVKFSADGLLVALSAAVRPDVGPIHVERIDARRVVDGTRWLVDWLAQRPNLIVVDGKSGAGALVAELRRKGVPERRIKRPTVDEVITAHADFVNAVRSGELTHLSAEVDRALADSVLCAGRRPIGTQGGWGFTPVTDDGDVTLAESALLARWGATQARRAKQPARTGGGRRAVVL